MARDQWGNRIKRNQLPLIDATNPGMGPRGPMPYPQGVPYAPFGAPYPPQVPPVAPQNVPLPRLMPIGNLSGIPTPNYGATIPPFQQPEAMDFDTFMTLDPRVQDQVYAQMSPEKREQFAQQGVQAIPPEPRELSPREREEQLRQLLKDDGMDAESAAHYAAGGTEWNDPKLEVPAGSEITPGGSMYRPHDFPSGNVNPAYGHPNANPAHEVEHAKDQLEKVKGAMGGDPEFHTNPYTGEIIRIPARFRRNPNTPEKIKEREDNLQAWHESQDSGDQDLDKDGNPYNDGKVIAKNERTAYVNDPGAAHHQASFNPSKYRYNRETGRVEAIATQWETPGTKKDREEKQQEAADVGVVEEGPLESGADLGGEQTNPEDPFGIIEAEDDALNPQHEDIKIRPGEPNLGLPEAPSLLPEGMEEPDPEGMLDDLMEQPIIGPDGNPIPGGLNAPRFDAQGNLEPFPNPQAPRMLEDAVDPETWGFGSDFNMMEQLQDAGEDPSLLGLAPEDAQVTEAEREPWEPVPYAELESPTDFRGNAERRYQQVLAELEENLRRSKRNKKPVGLYNDVRSPSYWQQMIDIHLAKKGQKIDQYEKHNRENWYEQHGALGQQTPYMPNAMDFFAGQVPSPYMTHDPVIQSFLNMGPLSPGMGPQVPPIQPPMQPPNPMALDPALSLPPNALNNIGR